MGFNKTEYKSKYPAPFDQRIPNNQTPNKNIIQNLPFKNKLNAICLRALIIVQSLITFLAKSGVSKTLLIDLKSSKTKPHPFTTHSNGSSATCVKIPVS